MSEIKQKISQAIEGTQFRALIDMLTFIFNGTDDNRIRRTSKSLSILLTKERGDKMDR
jgi:hypothetical protein